MKIHTWHFIDGARKAKGIAVIIDVFRAFTVECYLAANNATCIVPVAGVDFAYRLKEKSAGCVLIGERDEVMPPGFDYGNSPAQIEHVDFTGKTVVHTTSAGTQGLENAAAAEAILTGSLVNSKAIAKYISQNGFDEVSLVPMGWAGVSETPEDTLCAFYIENLLRGAEPDIAPDIERLKSTSGKRFFDRGNIHSPERDFELCTDLNRFDFVLKVERNGGMLRSRKISI